MGKAKAARAAFKSLRKGKKLRKKKGAAAKNIKGGAAAGALGGLGAAINEMMSGDEAKEMQTLPATVTQAAANTEKAKKRERTEFNAADVLEGTLIPRQDIIPELGPEEGQYSQHLNLIIERVARLEEEVYRQSLLLNKVASIIDEQTEFQKSESIKEERRYDEEQVEEQSTVSKIIDAGVGMAKAYGAAAGVKYGAIAGMAALWAGSEVAADELEDNTTPMDDVFDTLEFVEETALKATMGVAALRGTPVGPKVAEAAKGMAEKTKAKAVKASSPLVKGVKNVAGVAKDLKTDLMKGPGAKPPSTQLTVVKPKTPMIGTTPNAAKAIPPQINNAAKYQKYLANMKSAQGLITKISKKAGEWTTATQNFIKSLPSRFAQFIKFLGKNIVKWALIIEAIMFMIRSTELLLLGSITEEEWHKGNKEQINKIISLFGAPWVIAKIGFLVGSVIPVLGNAAGGVAGLIIGVIWGDKIYTAIGMDKLVSALYDFIVLGKTDGLKSCWNGLVSWVTKELPAMMAEAAKDVALAATGVDIAMTEEELAENYGEGTSTADILLKAGEGIGTDEDAILGALNRVKTKQDWIQLQQDFKAINEDQTLDEYLQDELSVNEYEKAMDMVDTNLGLPPKIRVNTKGGVVRLTKEQIIDGIQTKTINRFAGERALVKLEEKIAESPVNEETPMSQNVIIGADGSEWKVGDPQRPAPTIGMEIPDGQVRSTNNITYTPAEDRGGDLIVVKQPARSVVTNQGIPIGQKVPLETRPSAVARDSFISSNPHFS